MNPSRPTQNVLVVGAGIAGLSAAIALHHERFSVTVLERDPPPPTEQDLNWRRAGVPHAVQPHFFMGRLRQLLGERYPRLLELMRSQGVGETTFPEYIHPSVLQAYRPRAQDRLLTVLAARRTVLERLMRRYVQGEDLATIVSGATVTNLCFAEGTDKFRVSGVEANVEGQQRSFDSDLVVDASGRAGELGKILQTVGAKLATERFDLNSAGDKCTRMTKDRVRSGPPMQSDRLRAARTPDLK
jgi:2-polyprenyl-6-methoxyphenol hydroxylase-like FAD-dependent oxidoreductase